MWIYSQSNGQLWCPQGFKLDTGYSGFGEGKNNPRFEASKNIGPIPRGKWFIGEMYNSDKVGNYAIRLHPNGHESLGRYGFLIHGDSISNPGKASRGCIILSRDIRFNIHDNLCDDLMVIE